MKPKKKKKYCWVVLLEPGWGFCGVFSTERKAKLYCERLNRGIGSKSDKYYYDYEEIK